MSDKLFLRLTANDATSMPLFIESMEKVGLKYQNAKIEKQGQKLLVTVIFEEGFKEFLFGAF